MFFIIRYKNGIARYRRNSQTNVQNTPDVAIWSDTPLMLAPGGLNINGNEDINHCDTGVWLSGFMINVAIYIINKRTTTGG